MFLFRQIVKKLIQFQPVRYTNSSENGTQIFEELKVSLKTMLYIKVNLQIDERAYVNKIKFFLFLVYIF